MTDNINKNIENEELDLEKLENVSGGLNCDMLALADRKPMMGAMKLGLASGLAPGLASGSASGLASRLTSGLASGLASGSASDLAADQAMRLTDNAALLGVSKKR